MAKITLNNVNSLQNENSALAIINANSAKIATAFDNTLSRDGSTPNAMEAQLDMNSNRIINLPVPLSDTEPARLVDLEQFAFLPGEGNVVGPASAVGGNLPVFQGNSGKLITDSGTSLQDISDDIDALNTQIALKAPIVSPSFTGGITSGPGAFINIKSVQNAANQPNLSLVNTSATNGTKNIRINPNGSLAFINSANTVEIANLSDTGNLGIVGNYTGNGTQLTGVETSAHATATYSPILRPIVSVPTGSTNMPASWSGSVAVSTLGSTQTVIILTNAAIAIPVGAQFDFIALGTRLEFFPATGVTLRSLNSNRGVTPNGACTLVKWSADDWFLSGALVA